jgi:hypothetical protein
LPEGHGKFIQGLSVIERCLRRLTAAVFIAIGVYFTIVYTLELNLFGGPSVGL